MSFKKVERMDDYELLNLPADAGAEDMERACLFLASVYDKNSLASYHAISDQERQWIIERIRKARQTLPANAGKTVKDEAFTNPHEAGKPSSAEKQTPRPCLPDQLVGDKITGANLKNIRRSKGASLDQIADITKVKKSYLEAIEREDMAAFPAPVFMKGFLKAYARALGLNPAEITEKYMAE